MMEEETGSTPQVTISESKLAELVQIAQDQAVIIQEQKTLIEEREEQIIQFRGLAVFSKILLYTVKLSFVKAARQILLTDPDRNDAQITELKIRRSDLDRYTEDLKSAISEWEEFGKQNPVVATSLVKRYNLKIMEGV